MFVCYGLKFYHLNVIVVGIYCCWFIVWCLSWNCVMSMLNKRITYLLTYLIKDCARGITLLKLTTDGNKASRGLSATAELLVLPGRAEYADAARLECRGNRVCHTDKLSVVHSRIHHDHCCHRASVAVRIIPSIHITSSFCGDLPTSEDIERSRVGTKILMIL